jgi:hypothetical protein
VITAIQSWKENFGMLLKNTNVQFSMEITKDVLNVYNGKIYLFLTKARIYLVGFLKHADLVIMNMIALKDVIIIN